MSEFMKELNINGAVVQGYPLNAAQRIHNYTIKFAPHQVINIGTGFYIQIDINFDILRKAIKMAYERFDCMRLRFAEDEDGKEMKDENGKAYAYRDAAGNYYELNFGLSY